MKILLLSQFFSTTRGGGEYVFSMIARSMAKEGNLVWIVTNKIKNEMYDDHENIKIIFVPPLLEYGGGLPPRFYDNLVYVLSAIRKGFSIIKEEKIDIIHSNNFAPALAGSILSNLTFKPHITTIHDIFSLCGKKYWKCWGKQNNVSRLNVLLAPFFEKMILKLKHHAIHTVSEATESDLIKFGAKKPIYVIPNSIEIMEPFKSESIPFQFIYVGRLVFYKNLEIIIKAIKIVKERHTNITLIIVGVGPHKDNLEKMVSDLNLRDNIKFIGFADTKKKIELIATSQALLFPSLCEGFGLVILEAFAQKKPVLVSNVRPLSDIVTDKVTGFVISPYDEIKWAEMLIEIIQNPENAAKMGYAGYEILQSKYTIKNMQNKILEMYNDLICSTIKERLLKGT